MKTIKSAYLAWLTLTLAAAAATGGNFQPGTDINPALPYYQAYLLAPD